MIAEMVWFIVAMAIFGVGCYIVYKNRYEENKDNDKMAK